jgi:hypothetical protein
MKKILIILFISFALAGIVSCDGGTSEITATEGPKGDLNLDISGKTFMSETMYDNEDRAVYKRERTYDASGNVTSATQTVLPMIKSTVSITFNADGTFSAVFEDTFTSNFDGKISWNYKEDSSRKSLTYTDYEYGNDVDYELGRSFDEFGSFDGEELGDDVTYSGYADKTFYKQTVTGMWETYTLESDGLEEYTTRYKLKVTNTEEYELNTSSLPAFYSGKSSTNKDVYQYIFEELVYKYSGEVDGKKVYEFSHYQLDNLFDIGDYYLIEQ